jgi:hypothetical protein
VTRRRTFNDHPKIPPGVLHIYSAQGTVPAMLRDVIDGRALVKVVTDLRVWPDRCDYYCMTAGLSVKAEQAAARACAMLVVLPEGAEWLTHALWARITAGRDTWIFPALKAGDAAHTAYR